LGSRNANSRDSVFFGGLGIENLFEITFTDTGGGITGNLGSYRSVGLKSTVRTKKKPVKILCIQAVC
jgi:hypothetical protein